jgi:hypothetical protein
VAERCAAAPRSPRRLPRRRCAYALLCEVPCDCGQVLLLALAIARDPPHTGLSRSKGENAGYPKGRRLDRPATNTSTSRPALTPHLESEIARGQAILDRIAESIHPRSGSRATEDLLNPDSPIASLPHGVLHNVPHVCDVALSPTRAKGHVAERRAAAPRSPSRPAGAAMYIRAVMCRCARLYQLLISA